MAHAKKKTKPGNGNGGNGGNGGTKKPELRIGAADIIRTRRLELVGADGRQAAVFATDAWEGKPALILGGDDGKPRLMLAITAGGPLISLMNANRKPAMTLALMDDSSAITLYDNAQHARAEIRVGADGAPQLRLLDVAERSRIALDAPDKGSAIRLLDGAGKLRVLLTLMQDSPALVFMNAKNEKKAAIVATDVEGEVVVFGEGGKATSVTSSGLAQEPKAE
jgi:hypothetical protein